MTTTTTLSELTGDYVLDAARTRIGFAARALVTKVRGQFDEFEGSAHLDGGDPSRSSVQLTIQAASIQTGLQRRDDHLRNHFLDSVNHPLITFTSTRVEQAGGTTFAVTGDLAIRGVTKPVTVDFELTGTMTGPGGSFRAGFQGRAAINRREWGVSWNTVMEGGDALIGGKVTLDFVVAVVRQS
jgi:polyisoprenoid-binding protein YceI